MTYVKLGYTPSFELSGGAGTSTINCSGNSMALAWVSQMPKTGNIIGTFLRLTARVGSAASGSGPNAISWRIGIEDQASGISQVGQRFPVTGTLTAGDNIIYRGNNSGYVDIIAPIVGTGFFTFNNSVAVTGGDIIAVTCRVASGTVNSNNYLGFASSTSTAGSPNRTHGFYGIQQSTGWVPFTAFPSMSVLNMAVQYDDNTWYGMGHDTQTNVLAGLVLSLNPRFAGNRFIPNMNCKAIGAYLSIIAPSGGIYKIQVYSNNDVDPIYNHIMQTNRFLLSDGINGYMTYFPFSGTVTMTTGNAYYWIFSTSGSPTGCSLLGSAFWNQSSKSFSLGPDSSSLSYTTGVPGTWGIDTVRIASLIPYITEVDIGTPAGSAGMLIHPGMCGGARG
jgi:hypothetical protein